MGEVKESEYQYLALRDDAETYGTDFESVLQDEVEACDDRESALEFLNGIMEVHIGHIDYGELEEELYLKVLDTWGTPTYDVSSGTRAEISKFMKLALGLMPIAIQRYSTRPLSEGEREYLESMIEDVKEGWYE